MRLEDFKKELIKIRKYQRIKQTQMAKVCGFNSSQTIHQLERGKSRKIRELFLYVEKLGYTIELKRNGNILK